MKGNFWRKLFRSGYDTNSRYYNGKMAKTDGNTSRTKLKKYLNNILPKEKEDEE